MSGMIISTILWKGWGFPGTGPLPTLWPFMVGSDLSCFPGHSDSKEYACNAGDLGSIPGPGRSFGEGHSEPF